jgi:hypothetical protein
MARKKSGSNSARILRSTVRYFRKNEELSRKKFSVLQKTKNFQINQKISCLLTPVEHTDPCTSMQGSQCTDF